MLDNRDILSGVCGANDGNLKVIEGSIGGRIAARGNEIRLEGAGHDGVKRFKSVMDNLIALVKEGETPSARAVLRQAAAGELSLSHAEKLVYDLIPAVAQEEKAIAQKALPSVGFTNAYLGTVMRG